jgi:GNAT superfamily N-acetyltransferase
MNRIEIRNAQIGDIGLLAQLRGDPVFHMDRIVQAEEMTWRYLVVLKNQEPVGWGCLILDQPRKWPVCKPLPKMIDIWISPQCRSLGLGTSLIRQMEAESAANGFLQLYVSVDPAENRRALALYERLGYREISCPEWLQWEYFDSQGARHSGEGWDITMAKTLIDNTSMR